MKIENLKKGDIIYVRKMYSGHDSTFKCKFLRAEKGKIIAEVMGERYERNKITDLSGWSRNTFHIGDDNKITAQAKSCYVEREDGSCDWIENLKPIQISDKLSETQINVLEKMKENWELGSWQTFGSRHYTLQKNGIGKGGETKTVAQHTVHALMKKEFIEIVKKDGYSSDRTYVLTQKSKDAKR